MSSYNLKKLLVKSLMSHVIVMEEIIIITITVVRTEVCQLNLYYTRIFYLFLPALFMFVKKLKSLWTDMRYHLLYYSKETGKVPFIPCNNFFNVLEINFSNYILIPSPFSYTLTKKCGSTILQPHNLVGLSMRKKKIISRSSWHYFYL